MQSKQAIEEFKKIYFEEFSQELSEEEAVGLANKLLWLFRVIYKPLPRESEYETITQTS